MKYKISVGEPWNFEGPDGQNCIIGEVIDVLSPTVILFKSDRPQKFEELTGNIFLLSARYVGDSLVSDNGCEGTVGGGLLLTEDYDGRDEAYLSENSKYVLIGGISKLA
jgi:hypothetical protein